MFEGLQKGDPFRIGLLRPEISGSNPPDLGESDLDLRSMALLNLEIPWRIGDLLTGEILEAARGRAIVRLEGRVWLADVNFPAREGETITVQVGGLEGGKPVLRLIGGRVSGFSGETEQSPLSPVSGVRAVLSFLSSLDPARSAEISEWLTEGSRPGKEPDPLKLLSLRLIARMELPARAGTAQAIYEYLHVPRPLSEVLWNLAKDVPGTIGKYFYPLEQIPDVTPGMTSAIAPGMTPGGPAEQEAQDKLPALLRKMDPEMPWAKEARAIIAGLRQLNQGAAIILDLHDQAPREQAPQEQVPQEQARQVQSFGTMQAQDGGAQQVQSGGARQAPGVTFLQIPVFVDGEAFTVHLRLDRRQERDTNLRESREYRGRKGFNGSDNLSVTLYLETRWLGALKADLRFGPGRSLTCAVQVEQERTRRLLAEHYQSLRDIVAEAGFALHGAPKITVRRVRRTPDTPLMLQNLWDYAGMAQNGPGEEAHSIDIRL